MIFFIYTPPYRAINIDNITPQIFSIVKNMLKHVKLLMLLF